MNNNAVRLLWLYALYEEAREGRSENMNKKRKEKRVGADRKRSGFLDFEVIVNAKGRRRK